MWPHARVPSSASPALAELQPPLPIQPGAKLEISDASQYNLAISEQNIWFQKQCLPNPIKQQPYSLRQCPLVIEEKHTLQRLALGKIIKYIKFVSSTLPFLFLAYLQSNLTNIIMCLPLCPYVRCVGYKQFVHSLVRKTDLYTTNSNRNQTL